MDTSLSRGLSKTTRSRFVSAPVVIPQPPNWLRCNPKNRRELLRFVERFSDALRPRAVSFLTFYRKNQILHSYFVLHEARHVHQAYDLRETGYELHWVGAEFYEKGNPNAWNVTLPLVIGKHAFDRLHQRFGNALFAQSKVYSDEFAEELLFVLDSACLVSGPAWRIAQANGWTEIALPLNDGALICEVTEQHLLARTCLTDAQLSPEQRSQRELLHKLESEFAGLRELVESLRSFDTADVALH